MGINYPKKQNKTDKKQKTFLTYMFEVWVQSVSKTEMFFISCNLMENMY